MSAIPTLTTAQDRALHMLHEEEWDNVAYRRRPGSPNWYHPDHRPGNLYIDARTARVLIDLGLAETKGFGPGLYRTALGTQVTRA